MVNFTQHQLDTLADALVHQGYSILDQSLPDRLLRDLQAHFMALQGHGFSAAGIGRRADYQQQAAIRSDKIHWLSDQAPAAAEFLACMEGLRLGLNRRLFMGLFDYESHFAHYSIGAFYKKHRDAFAGQSGTRQPNRVLSTVLYLNSAWQPHEGGELLIYAEDGEAIIETVAPVYGRMVIFLSEKFPHEVLPATRERRSIAGWFRVNESAGL